MLRRLAPALATLLLAARAGAASPDPRIADWAWDQAAAGATAPVIVLLRDQADLSAAATLPDRLDRRRFVHLALTEAAGRSQPPLLAWLAARGIAHRGFVIVNAVALRADRATLLQLARRGDVARIAGDSEIRLDLPAPRPEPKSAQWNVAILGAPAAWDEGHDGEGIVVGVQDTGMRWTHEALRTKYRGWDAGAGSAVHDHSWRDAIHAGGNGGPCGTDSPEPCDDSGHGTHVTGTAVGGDAAGDALGVAPGARWIGCRDMDVGWGSPSRYLECFEFFLAPTDLSGDPATADPLLAPDVTSNSWACPPAEGCSWDVLAPAIAAHRAAGIMTVVAAGNSGPACGSIVDPPAILGGAYTVGATDSADAVADFSSRGPAGTTGLVKPDVVAPGVGIRSCTSAADDAYDFGSGTSMATPHVAGAVALLWSARPTYRGRIDETEELLNRTALRLPAIQEGCGGDDVSGPNATWGHGRIDLARALAEACVSPEDRCDDAFDSDCDGALDCDDADCDGSGACAEGGRCADGRDNDGDGRADCADGDCAGDAACPEAGHCEDGVDNDLDVIADCGDSDCAGDAACPETGNCDDGIDNDLDALTDCADDDCSGNTACPEAGRCSDALDNDADGRIDCADPDCSGDAACPEPGHCADGTDNDADGSTDCADAECVPDATCASADFDGDGATNAADCAPFDGSASATAPPSGEPLVRVARAPSGDIALEWDAPPDASLHDVARGDLATLPAGGSCVATAIPASRWTDASPAPFARAWYLVRSSNACGPGLAGWGADSMGRARAGCP